MTITSWLLAQTAAPDWFFSRLDSNELLGLSGLAVGLIIGLAALSFSLIDKMHRRRTEVELKREMVERGMSVDEIERVLAARLSANK